MKNSPAICLVQNENSFFISTKSIFTSFWIRKFKFKSYIRFLVSKQMQYLSFNVYFFCAKLIVNMHTTIYTWYVHKCQLGYRISNSRQPKYFDFITKINEMERNLPISGIDIFFNNSFKLGKSTLFSKIRPNFIILFHKISFKHILFSDQIYLIYSI